MPTKTIYVADADLPVFDRAQALAGDNLSAAIVQALRRFVEAHESRDPAGGQLAEYAVQLGDNGTYVTRRFRGRLLARRQTRERERSLMTLQTVYETAKGHFAVHTAACPDRSSRSTMRSKRGRNRRPHDNPDAHDDRASGLRGHDWPAVYGESDALRLDVYGTLDELRAEIPPELYNAVDDALRGPEAEFLDI
jgi:EXLDI family protein